MTVPPSGNRDANTRETAKAIGGVIDEVLPTGWGFFLCLFPFNDGEGRVNYIANGQRKDILVMLRNLVRQLERNPGSFGKHTDDTV